MLKDYLRHSRPEILRDNLMLWLDAQDFHNNRATKLWYDRMRTGTFKYTNAVTNGDFSNGATGWTLWSAVLDSANGEAIFTGNTVGSYPNIYKTLTAVVGRKYYFTAEVMVENAADIVRLAIRSEGAETTAIKDNPVAGTWYKLSCVKTCGNVSMTFAPSARYISTAAATGKKVHVRKCMAVDLTAIFGAASEPAVDESNTIMPVVAVSGMSTRASSVSPQNMIEYNPLTWGEWTNKVGSISADGYYVVDAIESYINIPTVFKPSTKYGFLCNIKTNTRTNVTYLYAGNSGQPFGSADIIVGASTAGNFKSVVTSIASITDNKWYTWAPANAGKIEIGNMRAFELPPGSQIEADFTNLTADQLAIKYPMQRAAIPYNFGYIAPYVNLIADFTGKTKANTVVNPHISKYSRGTMITSPTGGDEIFDSDASALYSHLYSDDTGYAVVSSTNTVGDTAQQTFSFNLIALFERRYGAIPCTDQTVAGKVAWLKANIKTGGGGFTPTVICYGDGPKGKKIYLKAWDGNAWNDIANNTATSPTATSYTFGTPAGYVMNDGWAHFMICGDPARSTDGTFVKSSETLGLTQYGIIENITRGSGWYGVDKVVSTTAATTTRECVGQTAGDVIKTYAWSRNVPAEAGTNETTIVLANHGLATGDYCCNWSRGGAATWDKLTVVDANTFTRPAITGQTAGDSIGIMKYSKTVTLSSAVMIGYTYADHAKLEVGFKAASGSDYQGGVVFEGVDDYVTLPDLTVKSKAAYVLKFKLNALTNNKSICGWCASDNSLYYKVHYQSSKLCIAIRSGVSDYTIWEISNITPEIGVYYTVVINMDGVNNPVVYVNGTLATLGLQSISGTVAVPSLTGFSMGKAGANDSSFLNSTIATAIRYDDINLTSQQAAHIYSVLK